MGPEGIQGPAGIDGVDGAAGATGADGAPGADGATGATGATGANGADGADALWNFTGAYSAGASYAIGDVATYAGETWYRIDANGGNVGDTPAEGTFWTLLAAAGVDGADGAAGATGATGDTGPAGEAGAPGAPGADGADGADGASVRNGEGPPTELTTGNTGDFYLDTLNNTLWGPKPAVAVTNWPVAASGFMTGYGVPSPGIGIDGEYYIDQIPYVLYLKVTGSWVVVDAVLLTGGGAPTDETGDYGDYYADLAESMLYGPKVLNHWGPSVSLLVDPLSSPFAAEFEGAWTAPVPATYHEAVNRLASAFYEHLGVSIP